MSELFIEKGRARWLIRRHALEREREASLEWTTFLPHGQGSKHQREYLLDSSKKLIELMFDETCAPAQRRFSSSTVEAAFGRQRLLVAWMVRRGIWRYSQLQVCDVIDFLKDRKPRADVISEGTIRVWMGHFQRMWQYRAMYKGAMRLDVSLVEDEIACAIRQRRNSPWKGFDEDVAMAAIKDALAWLEEFGPFLVTCTQISWQHFDRFVGLGSRRRKNARKELYQHLEQLPTFGELRKKLEEPTLRTNKVLSKAVSVTEGACVTVLLLLVGFRAAELAALNKDCLTTKKVGAELLPYLEGIAAKASGRARHWVAADPIPKVVEFLLDFNALARKRSKTQALLLARPPGCPISLPGKQMKRFTGSTLASRMTIFMKAPFRASQPKSCHPHMARKTFAKLAVRRDKRALEPVAHHLGHAFREFTDGAYVGADHELSQLLEEEDRRELSTALTTLLSKPIAGPVAKGLKALEFRGKRGLSQLVDSLIGKGVQIAPCDWGYCVYSESMSACRGDSVGPNEANRSPDVCASCANFGVSEKHLSWWNERVSRESQFLERPNLPLQTRKIVQLRLENSNRILRELVLSTKKAPSAHTTA